MKFLLALKKFLDDVGVLNLAWFSSLIWVLILSVIGIYHYFNPPDIIERNGYEYELQHSPALYVDEYGWTYALKEGETE